jgi:tetratricopeptide (TPR) repeat protein
VKRQADALVGSLREFIAQPDYPTLVLNGSDSDMILPNRTLASLDAQDDENYYLVFPQSCADAGAYMSIVAQGLADQLEVVNTELRARQLEPIPELPPQVRDARYSPAQRLRAAIDHCGEHLPSEAPIVWGLMPGDVPDRAGYRKMIDPLLAPKAVEPWMDRHRFIVRDHAPEAPISKELLAANNDRILVMDLDFSNERFVQDLVETAQDQRLPGDERMNAFFTLGAIDMALKRYPQALEKYGVCFNYFNEKGNVPMQALCLTGAADTMRHAGRPEESLKYYQRGLALGVELKNVPIIQQNAYGAGVTCLDLQRNEEAAGYLKHADDAAAKMHNPYAKCDAMEKRGLAAWRLGKTDEAVDVWMKGKELAKQFSYLERAASILNFLIALCRHSALYHRVAEFESERAALGISDDQPGVAAGAPGAAPADGRSGTESPPGVGGRGGPVGANG